MNEELLVKKLIEKNYTIGSVESLTAGLFTATLASVPGVSATLKGGLVTYASELKTSLADVSKDVIDAKGVVSKEVAKLMAEGGQKKLLTNVVVSFTGNAGPSVLDNKKVGEVYMGFKINDKDCIVIHHIFNGSRNEIREQAVQFACEQLLKMLS